MNSTKQLINNEILKKKYSMPCSKETTLSNLLNKNAIQFNQITNRLPGPLSQRLLRKTENHKVIDDLYKFPKPEMLSVEKPINSKLQQKEIEKSGSGHSPSTEKKRSGNAKKDQSLYNEFEGQRKDSVDFSKENTQKSSHINQNQANELNLTQGVSRKHNELNNLIKILRHQNSEVVNIQIEKSELQKKILSIKEKLQTNMTNRCKNVNNSKILQHKTQGFHSHRGAVPKYIKDDEYLLIQKSNGDKKSKEMSLNVHKEVPNEIADLYLLTNENIVLEHFEQTNVMSKQQRDEPETQHKKPTQPVNNNNNNNSRSLNESDLEKLLNNPNIQPSNKRLDYPLHPSQPKTNHQTLLNTMKKQKNENISNHYADIHESLGRKFSLDEKKNGMVNDLEGKAKKLGGSQILQEDLKVLKERISSTLGKYKAKTDKLEEINMFLYNKIQRDGLV